jgi:hypothetical protein
MRRNQQGLWLGISILGVLTWSSSLALGQTSPDVKAGAGVPTDWSHHHLIFSKPANAEQARRVQKDVRYWQQLARQSPATLPEADLAGALTSELQPGSNSSISGKNSGKNQELKRDWSQDMGSGASVGAGNFPAKFSFRPTTANCGSAPQPDFVVYGTGLFGSAAQANVVAYDNLYSGCIGTVPTLYWAYNTGSTVVTSPEFSDDGTQVAFVQRNGEDVGILVLLRWAASATESITSPLVLPRTARTLYSTCTAPCMTTLALRDGSGTPDDDIKSSVFIDYNNDAAYVGDASGWLHKFSPVFNGTPDEVRTGGWPVLVNLLTPTALTSPVHDYVSGNVFVADVGGFLYQVDSTTAAVTQSGQLDFSSEFDTSGPGIVEGPIVDVTSGFVYVFATSDGSGFCIGGADCTAVYQLKTNFLANNTGSEAVVGASSVEPATPNPLYAGGFDSTYENSVNATGHLYVCGNTGGPPILYQVAIQGGVLGTVNAGPVLSNDTTPCSSVTDILNPNATGGATEWVFASAGNDGVSSVCASGGCIFNFKDTPWLPLASYTVGQEIVDSNFHIEFVGTSGTSGAGTPFWSISTGGSTTDGSVSWLDLGPVSAFPPAVWAKNHHYSKGAEILDGNNNVELVTTAGVSGPGPAPPAFNTAPGGTTSEGPSIPKLTWTNVGPPATAAMPEGGGTSGIIIDNTVGSGTLAGASQIYFSPLSNQVCGTSGTGGCAVQASQSALQ